MFCYTVSMKANKEIFFEICKLIETYFHACNIEKLPLVEEALIDVDYYLSQEYIVNGQKIKVVCENIEIDVVYVDSTIDLKEALNGKIVVKYVK